MKQRFSDTGRKAAERRRTDERRTLVPRSRPHGAWGAYRGRKSKGEASGKEGAARRGGSVLEIRRAAPSKFLAQNWSVYLSEEVTVTGGTTGKKQAGQSRAHTGQGNVSPSATGKTSYQRVSD